MSRWFIGGSATVSIMGLAAYALTQSPLKSGAIPGDREQFFQKRIEEAQNLNKQNFPVQAIRKTIGIPRNSRHFTAAQKLQDSLSQQILDQAKIQYRQGNVDNANSMLQVIPAATTAASEGSHLRKAWVKEGQQLQAIRQSVAQEKWAQAMQLLEGLRQSEIFNSPSVQSLFQEVVSRSGTETVVATTQPLPVPITQIPSQIPVLNTTPPPPPVESAVAVNVDEALQTTANTLERATSAYSVPVVTLQRANTTPQTIVATARDQPPSSPANSLVATAPVQTTTVQLPMPMPTSSNQESQVSSPRITTSAYSQSMQTANEALRSPRSSATMVSNQTESQPSVDSRQVQATTPAPNERSIPPAEPLRITASPIVTTAYSARSMNPSKPDSTTQQVELNNSASTRDRLDSMTEPLPATRIEEMVNASVPKTSQRLVPNSPSSSMQTSSRRLLTEVQRQLSKVPVVPDLQISVKAPSKATTALSNDFDLDLMSPVLP